ncbi:RICIN domain-containing protein [Puia dinghuensis]|uniref:Carbohydrate-binding protein n=1 Tax=Puia dinghuensis TaxID=1792502 RepID=A0A8J2UDQ1_9BACT|nr:RICIN domain-containing protein [Puia dinghuensis]GGB03603.1 carbohydrate-binding protein [Puia dinghuensis]
MKRLLFPAKAMGYACMLASSFLLLFSCQKSVNDLTTAGSSRSGKTTAATSAAVTANIAVNSVKGLNWADPNDNFSSGNVVPTGLSSSDSYATTQSKANNILVAFQQQGANTIRIPINTYTVNNGWWGSYTGAIDAAVSKGMNVILGYWDVSGGNGTVANTTDYWNMWSTVVNKYGSTSNVFFEVFNEPHGYSVANLTNLYATWLSNYSSVPAGRVLLDGAGYATDVNDVGADSRLTGCLLSYHNYTWFNNNLTTSADWENSLQSINYASRTIMTEFGAPMTTGDNYLGAPGSNRDIAYIQGVTNQLRASGMGGVYWPGLRSGDSYSLLTLSGTTVSLNNSSGLSRIQYAWGSTSISQPYGSFTSGAYYKILDRNSGDALEIYNQSTTAGAIADQWSYWGGNNQQWSFSSLGSGYFNLINRNSSMYLDVNGASTANGASIIQWTSNGGSNQKWQVIDIGFGYFKVVNQNSGQDMDVNGASTANGASVIQWPNNGGRNQQWQIVGL